MSHIVRQKSVKISNLDALERALQPMGLRLIRGKPGELLDYKYYYNRSPKYRSVEETAERQTSKGYARHVITGSDQTWRGYDIGLVPSAKNANEFEVAYDDFGKEGELLERVVGKHASTLFANYNEQVFTETAVAQGYSVVREETPESVVLRAVAYV